MAKKLSEMTKGEQRAYNEALIARSDVELDSETDWLEKHPLLLHGAIYRARVTPGIDEVVELMWKAGGSVTEVAKAYGVARTTIKSWLKKGGQAELEFEISEAWTDRAELVLNHHVTKGSLEAAKFRLKTKGKDRGYYEKQEREINQTINVRLESDDVPEMPDKNIEYIEVPDKVDTPGDLDYDNSKD